MPVVIKLKEPSQFLNEEQHLIKAEAYKGPQPVSQTGFSTVAFCCFASPRAILPFFPQ